MQSLTAFVGLILLALIWPAMASDPEIPDVLRPWVPWVLEGDDRRPCPVDGAAAETPLSETLPGQPPRDGRICAWPGRLFLDLDDRGGIFAQRWTTYADTWVPLPGDPDNWPLDTRAGAASVPVLLREGLPAVKLAPGRHILSGRFQWSDRPNGLSLPPQTGLVSLTLDGVPVDAPRLDRGGRLWIGDPGAVGAGEEGDRLDLKVFRLIDDDLPLRVISRLELDVSGRARQVRIGPALLVGGVALRVQSPLPARLDGDGWLRIQIRPGHWVLELDAYHAGSVTALTRPSTQAPWPESEIWSFAANPDLRQVSVQGLVQVDPRQNAIPADWSRMPAYRVGPTGEMRLAVERRGNPDPGPDRLDLKRDLWLDFDGGGYSVQDRIGGRLTRSWRLEALAPLSLGQVRVGGEPRLITRLGEDGVAGVEVRQGRLALVADGRLERSPGVIPVSGWGLDLGSVQTRLRLPPGWDLLAVTGADNLPDSWISRWSLLDLFLVLVLVIGVQRLWGWPWGLLALTTLALTWNAPDAPRLVWLHVLAATALLRVLPRGERGMMPRLRGAVLWYFRLALLGLALVTLPFLVSQVRQGLFPQLERPWTALGAGGSATALDATGPLVLEKGSRRAATGESKSAGSLGDVDPSKARVPAPAPPPERQGPGDLVQSGPGIPHWQWRQFDLSWGGPVAAGEQVRLWLLSPRWGAALALLGSVLVVLLGWRMSGLGVDNRPSGGGDASDRGEPLSRLDSLTLDGGSRFAVPLLLVAAMAAAMPTGSARAGDLPDPGLLIDLKSRLLKPPDCLPECVSLPSLWLEADPKRLRLILTLDAAVAVAAPIPGGPGGWWPTSLLMDGEPLDAVRRGTGDELLVALPAGRHRLELEGPLPAASQVEIPFPLRPMQIQAAVTGWSLEGLDTAGRPGPQVRLLRLVGSGEVQRVLTQGALPPLLAVDRSLLLGSSWRVKTRLRRLSPAEFPLVLPVPLLPGESVQTPDIQVRDGAVLASLAPGETDASWVSSLEQVPVLRLTGAADTRLAESWSLDLAPIWHLEWLGIVPVQQQTDGADWLPTWRPLPGELLELRISRPAPIPGTTLTVDRVEYALSPGARSRDCTLGLAVRSTQGGSHVLGLPPGATPLRLSADGRDLPLPPQGGRLELPLVPGTQSVTIQWREVGGVGPLLEPATLDLGSRAVNLALSVTMPEDRWILFVQGPRMGPVVLFWGVLVVFSVLALLLARLSLAPLRTTDWLLLGIGLALAQPWVALLVVGWLLALGLRRRLDERSPRWRYNLIQVALMLLTLAALVGLFDAVSQGLLGRPEMQIAGNGSHGNLLRWYQDRGGPGLPEITVISLPMWVYRALMLAWALWLALRLLDWLRWGWEGFSRPVPWRETKLSLGGLRGFKRTPRGAPS